MNTPKTRDLEPALARTATGIAKILRKAGKQAWLVGGAVRDLALGRAPSEIDIATDARPDELEALFAGSLAVGKAFGTILVRAAGEDCEVTTFRSESGYSDGRRPDRVEFAATLEEDARRRDFTCNALYLDPLTDELRDPEGGLDDLSTGALRAVGDARDRFAEDALRILRLARFAASCGLEPEPEALAAARELGPELRGVSAERKLKELATIFERRDATRAFEILIAVDALEATLGESSAAFRGRVAVLRELGSPLGLALGLAALFDPDVPGALAPEVPGALAPEVHRTDLDAVRARLKALKPSSEVLDAVLGALALAPRLGEVAAGASSRADRILCLRGEAFEIGWRLAAAKARARGDDDGRFEALARERDELGPEGLFPAVLVRSDDLLERGVPRGPRFGELLRAAERAQLDGRFADREGALGWLDQAL